MKTLRFALMTDSENFAYVIPATTQIIFADYNVAGRLRWLANTREIEKGLA